MSSLSLLQCPWQRDHAHPACHLQAYDHLIGGLLRQLLLVLEDVVHSGNYIVDKSSSDPADV